MRMTSCLHHKMPPPVRPPVSQSEGGPIPGTSQLWVVTVTPPEFVDADGDVDDVDDASEARLVDRSAVPSLARIALHVPMLPR
jgi:hypothetical protein